MATKYKIIYCLFTAISICSEEYHSHNHITAETAMENDGTPMDEFEWEEFMKKSDAKAAKYSALLDKYMDDPNRDEIIAREMGWNTDLEEDGIERPWLDEMNDAVEEMMEDERSEEWKKAAGIPDGSLSGRDELEKDPLYRMGHSFAIDTIRWCESLSDAVKEDPDMRKAMEHLLIPAAKIAGAVALDADEENEKEMLGLRLANYKRGLSAVNTALTHLSAVREKGLIVSESIFPFIKQATELRNALAVRIVEVREQFNSL
jgi:hypothetical protein